MAIFKPSGKNSLRTKTKKLSSLQIRIFFTVDVPKFHSSIFTDFRNKDKYLFI